MLGFQFADGMLKKGFTSTGKQRMHEPHTLLMLEEEEAT